MQKITVRYIPPGHKLLAGKIQFDNRPVSPAGCTHFEPILPGCPIAEVAGQAGDDLLFSAGAE